MENKEQKQYYGNGERAESTGDGSGVSGIRETGAGASAGGEKERKVLCPRKRWERVRCTKDCSKCPYLSEKVRSAGAPLSLEMFAEQGIELRAPFDAEEALLETEERKERIKLVRTAVSKLKDRYQLCLAGSVSERSDAGIGTQRSRNQQGGDCQS